MITDAIISLFPGTKWSITDEDYVTLVWSEDNIISKPSLGELTVEIARLKGIRDSKEYQKQRAESYPAITDQLDMLWHMMNEEVIPGKGSVWYNAINDVKNTYQKP